ncbi:MAG: CAP domain-containing protein [Pseudomonadota bacterium]
MRSTVVLATAFLMLGLVAVPAAGAGRVSTVQSLERDVVAQVNAVRRQHGLAPLRVSSRLALAARFHSTEMGRVGYFGHASADGMDPITRLARFYPRGRYRSWWVGENLYWWSTTVDARQVVAAWLGSPPHRKQLLAPQYREVGISAVHVDDAPGLFRGLSPTIVTADFGVRAR